MDSAASGKCRVAEFGELGRIGDDAYYYAIYVGAQRDEDSATGSGGGLDNYYREARVFESVGNTDSATSIFGWGARVYDFWVDRPVLVSSKYGTFLHVFITSGNGGWEMGHYYIYRGHKWVELSYEDWLDGESWGGLVKKTLPSGYWLCRGNEIDLRSMEITFPVYKSNDPCCCPTGGTLMVKLKLEADSIAVDSCHYSPKEWEYHRN